MTWRKLLASDIWGPRLNYPIELMRTNYERFLPIRWMFFLLALVVAACSSRLRAQQKDNQPQNNPKPAVVAAKVNGEPIYVHEVQREVTKVVKGRSVQPDALKMLQAQALEQLVKRQLILLYLDFKGQGASNQDIALATERAEQQLKQQELTLEQFLQRSGLSAMEFRRALRWQISWKSFLERYLTDKNLESYFNKNRREFDGTQMRVAHILLKLGPGTGVKEREEAIAKAAALRDEIVKGDHEFATAAKKHSQSPSAKKGGDIGVIFRHQPMPESFSQAAFALEKNAVSEPVVSVFGVHLIKCLEITPGKAEWQDVRKEVEIAVTQYLFDWAASQNRSNALIEFTGKMPHFKPGTQVIAN